MNRQVIIGIFAAAVAVAIALVMISLYMTPRTTASSGQTLEAQSSSSSSNALSNTTAKIQIVAAENFWGSLVSQLGGDRVEVLSIVSDPNADPHEYESSTADARAIANANFVIINGAGYDSWALKLLGAESRPNQKLLNVADLVGKTEGDNPHFWYDPNYVNQTVNQMYLDLVSIDPAGQQYYARQYLSLNQSLGIYNSHISEIKAQFSGTRVAATEDIFAYLSNATGLALVSPPEFMQAVAEGNDPSAQSISQFQQLLQSGNVTMLVYNQQTVTPLTESIKALAAQKHIPTVAITETVQPTNMKFQDWMNTEVMAIQNALNTKIQEH